MQTKFYNSFLFFDDFYPLHKKFKKDDLQAYILSSKATKDFFEKFKLLSFSSETLFTSFIHRSFSNEQDTSFGNNEKLEFLGDAVLELYVSQRLYKELPSESEGTLSKIRSAIVNEETLFDISKISGLDSLILLGRGELKEGGLQKPSLISDLFEAILGAIFLERGEREASSYLYEIFSFYEKKKNIHLFSPDFCFGFDSKSKLQELCMKMYKELPVYKAQELQDSFEIKLILKGITLHTLLHPSKKKGMQELAKFALENKLYILNEG